jgi:hypothetical protein
MEDAEVTAAFSPAEASVAEISPEALFSSRIIVYSDPVIIPEPQWNILHLTTRVVFPVYGNVRVNHSAFRIKLNGCYAE